jgi:L-asparaginase II
MELFGNNVLAKIGAAGVYAIAVQSSEKYPSGLGVSIKIADGDSDSRVRRLVAIETLKQDHLAQLSRPQLVKFKALEGGKLLPVFNLFHE